MIVVTNTIRIRKGHGETIAERFKNPKGVHLMPGFVRMELLFAQDLEEHDELKVCTTWESREAFDGWVNSDSFKQAHAGRGKPAGAEGHAAAPSQEPPIMLGAQMSVHSLIFTQGPGER